MAVAKVFRIEMNGGRDVEKDISAIKKAITAMGQAIKQAKGELKSLVSSNADPAVIASLNKRIAELDARMKSLSQTRKVAETDAKRQAEVEKILADTKKKEAEATKALELAEKARVQSMIAQEKELDRQIALEQKESRELEKKKKLLDALPGSYNAIKSALSQLRPFIQSGGAGGTISFGGQQLNFDQAIAEYKRLSAAEQDFRRQFARDGLLVAEYSSGIVDAFKKMNIDDIIKGQVNGAKQQLGELEKRTNDLVVAYRQAQQSGSADLNKLEKEIHDNVVETQKLKKAVSEAEVQLGGVGAVGTQITNSISQGFKNLRNNIAQFTLGYVGFQALFSGLQSGIDNAKQFSDQTTELEIQLNKAAGGADNLVQELGKLDTRTKLTTLEEIANIALKAGTSEQNLLGVTKAIDTMKTAFGKDFGDIETGTETIVKLINIFFEDGQVTEDRILKIGNSIRTLANETVASVPFINDFSGRMAGLRQVANVTLPQIIGLGAGFEEFKQSSEVASTVLVKVIPQMARDVKTFAEIAGVTQEQFKKLLDDNPIEALLKVSEGFQKGNGNITEFAELMKEAGIEAGRTTTIIATLGGKADVFRKRIELANTSIQDTGAITDAFNRKNENLAATMDKVVKKFSDAAAGKGFQATIMVIATAITFLINNLGIIIGLVTAWTAVWALANKEMIATRVTTFAMNIALKAQAAWVVIVDLATKAYAVSLNILTAATGRAAVSSTVLSSAIKLLAGPLGIILTIIGLLGISMVAFGRSMATSVNNFSEFVRLQRINNEISKEAIKNTSEQIAAIDGWIAVIKSSTSSAKTNAKAISELIKIDRAFGDAIKGNVIDLKALDAIYQKVTESIKAKARAEAAATLSAGKQRKVTEIAALRQDLELQVGQTKGTVTEVELTDEQKKLLKQSNLFDTGAIIQFTEKGAQILRQRFDQIKSFLDRKEKEAISVYQDYLKAQALAQEQLSKLEKEAQTTTTPSPQNPEGSLDKLTLEELYKKLKTVEAEIKQVGLIRNKTKEVTEKLKGLRKERAEILRLIREQVGKTSGTDRASRLTGEQKDAFKDIDAIRDRLLAEQKKLFLDLQIDEKAYLQNTLQINTDAINQKLALIKGKNAEERKVIAELNLEKIDLQKQTNQRLFELENNRLEASLRNEELAAQRDRDTTLLNPDLTNEQRLKVEQEYQNRLLKNRIVFNQQQIALEKLYSISSIENEQKRKEAIEKLIQELNALQRQGPEARQKDIQDAADRQLDEFDARIAEQTIAILESNDSYYRKARDLQRLETQANKERLASEAAAAKISLDQARKDRDAKLISEQEYQQKLKDYKTKEAALYKATTNEQISATRRFILALKELKDSFLQTALGIKQYSKDAQGEQEKTEDASIATADIVRETINQAYRNYFANKEKQIEQEKQAHLESLDREKERVLATANSQAERDTIERQFEARRKKAEQKAAEEKKQLALKQATIDFGVAVIKTFAQFGFPLGLIPVAALTGAYLLQRAQIQKQTFEFGGNLKNKKYYGLGGNPREVPVKGGVFGGKPHSRGGTDFSFGGQQYNAEVDEMNVIRTKNAPRNKTYSITGNHSQIASALNTLGGGVSFSPGATVSQFANGGQLGTKLRPPTFNSGYYSSGVNAALQTGNDLQDLKKMVADVTAAVYASDVKEVQLNPGKVTKAQDRSKKDVSLGTI